MYFLDIMMNKYNLHLFSFVEDNGRDWRTLNNSDSNGFTDFVFACHELMQIFFSRIRHAQLNYVKFALGYGISYARVDSLILSSF